MKHLPLTLLLLTASTALASPESEIAQKAQALGFGAPTTTVNRSPARPDSFGQWFEGGMVYWTPQHGANAVHGTIGQTWATQNYEQGSWSFPASDEIPCAGPGKGDRYQVFEGGRAVWTAATNRVAFYPNPTTIGDGGNCAPPANTGTIGLLNPGTPINPGALLAAGTPAAALRNGRDLNTDLGPNGPQGDPESRVSDLDFATQSVCTTQRWGDSQVRALEGLPLLDPNSGVLYPGAIVQGRGFESGVFTPVTISRAGGTLTLDNVNLGGKERYSAHLDSVSGPAVRQAVQNMLRQGVSGTAAQFGLQLEQISDYNSLLLGLSLDARYGTFEMQSNLGLNQEARKNRYFIKFLQPFYTVNFEPPSSPTAVFRDGERFTDLEGQITPDNPPLYVASMSYGRAIFFVAETEASRDDLQAALNAAANFGGASARAELDARTRRTLDRTQIYYYAFGGSAPRAVGPIRAANATEMFEQVKALLADAEAAGYSPANPGLPIKYTLRYLKNNEVARTSFSVVYDRRDCTVTSAEGTWAGVPTGRIPTNDRANIVNYEIKRRQPQIPEGQVEFVLVLGAGTPEAGNNIYDKWLKLVDMSGNGIQEVQVTPSRRVASFRVPLASLNSAARLYIDKDNFGVNARSHAAILGDLEHLRAGDQVTVTWVREQN